jgi:hypothetical protein
MFPRPEKHNSSELKLIELECVSNELLIFIKVL